MAEHKYSYSHKQTAMSHVDSLDEETKQILKDIQSQETHSDDSKESDKSKKDIKEIKKSQWADKKNDDYNEYDVNDKDPLKDKEMDDSQW